MVQREQLESSPMKPSYKDKVLACKECTFQGKNQTEIRTHMNLKHTGKKEFNCRKCNFKGINQTSLNTHMNFIHNNGTEFNCKECQYRGINQTSLNVHMDMKHNRDKEFNCRECDFQGTNQIELNKHMNLKHRKGETAGIIYCRNCGEGFSTKWNLMNHRKSKHSDNIAYCRNFIDGNCPYSDEMCWWNHKNIDESIKCFICGNIFESKTVLMSHRKKDHGNLVKQCIQFQQNSCRFRSESCWFSHNNITKEKDSEQENNHNEEEPEMVFRKVSENLFPPIVDPLKNRLNRSF